MTTIRLIHVFATVLAVGGLDAQTVFQRLSSEAVPDEPYQWLVLRREGLYMRSPDDYVKDYIEARLEPRRQGNLFNQDSRTFVGVANSPFIGMIWADGLMRFEGVPGFGTKLFASEAPATLTFLPNNFVNFKQYLVRNYLPFVTTEWGYQNGKITYRVTASAVEYHGRPIYLLHLGAFYQTHHASNQSADPGFDPRRLPFSWSVLLTGADFELGTGGVLRNPAGVFGKCVGDFVKKGQSLETSGTLESPERWIVLAAAAPLDEQERSELTAARVSGLYREQEQRWERFLQTGAQYEMPLPMLADAYRASLINMKIAESKIDAGGKSYYLAVPGATIYRRFWWRDGAYILRAWDMAAHHEDARQGLELALAPSLPEAVNRMSATVNINLPFETVAQQLGSIARYQINQREDGSWTAPPGQWDSTGLALYALAGHYLMTRDAGWLAQAKPYMKSGAEFLMRARVGTESYREWLQKYWPAEAAAEKYAPPLAPGLLPGGGGEGGSDSGFRLPWKPHASPEELRKLGAEVPRQSYFHDLYAVLGLRTYAAVLAATGEDPSIYLQSANDMVKAIERSAIDTMRKLDITWMPAGPDGGVKTALIGALLFPCGVFPPEHPIATGTLNYFEANAKLHIAPEGFYGTHPDRWSYTQGNLAVSYLIRGDKPRADRVFDTFLRCMWLPGSWRENIREPHSRDGYGDQPHLWATAYYIMMLREFLLREQGDGLILADGMHPLWLPAGKTLSVRNVPTDFGSHVSYTMQRSDDGRRISLDVSVAGPAPKQIVWKPRGFGKLWSARLDGKEYEPQSDTIELTGKQHHVEVLFR